MEMISLQGFDLSYRLMGSGPPLLLLHGGGGPEADFPYAALLAERFEVIAPVHPGFGGTLMPDGFDRVDDLAFLYLDLLDALDLKGAVLMGTSLGGWVAAELAAMNAACLSRLFLVGPVGVKTGGREDRDIADVFALPGEKVAELLFHDPSLMPALADMPDAELQAAAANRVALGVYTWEPYMHNPKLPRRLHRIKIPTHFIWGASDGIVSVDYGRKYSALIGGATMTIIENAGHVPQIERPGAFVDAVFAHAV